MLRPCAVTSLAALLAISCPVVVGAQAAAEPSPLGKWRLGTLLQPWVEAIDVRTGGQGSTEQVFLRRARIILGGEIGPKVSFFLQIDNPNLGRSGSGGKISGAGLILQDAFAEWTPLTEFALGAGFMPVPLCRNCLQSAALHLTLDYGSYIVLSSTAMKAPGGRDAGVQLRGHIFRERLEYRIGAFQGLREPSASHPFRLAGRLQFELFDKEPTFVYPGTYLGAKRILAVGAGVDRQNDYHAIAFDTFVEWPTGKGSFTAQLDVIRWNGGSTIREIAPQTDLLLEGGFYFRRARTQVFGRVERQGLSSSRDERRTQVGVTHFMLGPNLNVRAALTRIHRPPAESTVEAAVQLQFYRY